MKVFFKFKLSYKLKDKIKLLQTDNQGITVYFRNTIHERFNKIICMELDH